MKKAKLIVLFLLMTFVLLIDISAVMADGLSNPSVIAIQSTNDLYAYSRPTPRGNFVGFARAKKHYDVIEQVVGNKGRTWYKVALDNGREGYIPALYTSPVITNAEEIAIDHAIIHHQGFINVHHGPYVDSALMGIAERVTVYPVLEKTASGWWRIALEDGTTGYVTSQYAHSYDPVEDTKVRHVQIDGRVVIRSKPGNDGDVLTGIGPGETLSCVHVCKNGWYMVETKHGGYGFIHSSVCTLVDDTPSSSETAANANP